MSLLDIVIVNWNSGAQLRDCLNTIAVCNAPLGRVVVVDNASADGSSEILNDITLPLTVVRNETNRGFGAACNQGARLCNSRYLLFLNPDTELSPGSLKVPLRFMDSPAGEDAGVCGIQLLNEDGIVNRCCARFPDAHLLIGRATGLSHLMPNRFRSIQLDEWPHDRTADVDHVIGAFYMIRRELFNRLDGFDERFFVYLEDLDLSKRVRGQGQRVVFLASAKAFHRENGTTDQIKSRRLFYSRRSRIQYAFKHFSFIGGGASALCILMLEPFAMVARSACRRSLIEMWQTTLGFRDALE